MTRRSFLATVAVAPVVPVLAKALPPSAAPVACHVSESVNVRAIITSALMQIGVLRPGEMPPDFDIANGHRRLMEILDEAAKSRSYKEMSKNYSLPVHTHTGRGEAHGPFSLNKTYPPVISGWLSASLAHRLTPYYFIQRADTRY